MELVVLKTAITATKGNTIFKANHFYRCIEVDNGYVVFGEWFDKREFDSLFEDAMAKVMRDWLSIGLLKKDFKPISKNAFKELADVHFCGRRSLKVLYFKNSRECIYGFYSTYVQKEEAIKEAYEWYLETLNGNYDHLDSTSICFGNCGIPLVYSKLRIN